MGQPISKGPTLPASTPTSWIQRLPQIYDELRVSGFQELDRRKFQIVFGLEGNDKAATRLMAKLGAQGKPLKLDRLKLMQRLEQDYAEHVASTDEIERRQNFARKLQEMRRERLEAPKCLVIAPPAALNTRLEQLQEIGVSVEAHRISLEFGTFEQCKKQLLLLALAIGNEPGEFVRIVAPEEA